jgi:hypothetical protein
MAENRVWPAADLKRWREEMGLSKHQAPIELGCSRIAYLKWERTDAPLYIKYACLWIQYGGQTGSEA